ncbi:MAG: T9SS type A sorting domain-containing protein [Flavobacteriales bacterium]|nr:T9SS type A sorting domain-containing protein [Flavobacteriales bacterium]MBP6697312.1 T9SS type A sorting domain-containing protein [Flavobacteriales bacterium]
MIRSLPRQLRSPLCFASFLVLVSVQAQHARPSLPVQSIERPYATGNAMRSSVLTTPRTATVLNSDVTTAWGTKVVRMSARNHGLPEVNAIKDAKLAAKLASATSGKPAFDQGSPKAITPEIGSSFEANWSTQQTPPDNSMAISNSGWIVSTNNDGILYYGTDGTASFGAFWNDFFAGQGLNANIYDPKVLYDSGSDRFFMVVLHGSDAATSKLLLCFSQTNNPNNGWNIYQLAGNVLNNNCWFDYPCIGVSNNEVYLTGNLFTSGNNQFQSAILLQIDKNSGYNNQNLNWQYWYNLQSDIGAFTLVPASWGQSGNYGPGVLLVSNASGGENRYVVWDLTADLGGNPALNAYTVNVAQYGPAADAQMPGTSDLLDNGDCRIMGAFYLDGKLHCIHHGDVGQGWNGVLYTRIDVGNMSPTQTTYGAPGVIDVSYPQLTSFATSTSDPNVMVAFLASSSQVFPEVNVVNCDANMQWGQNTLVKSGETYVDFMQGEDRWGDYTGMARKHNGAEAEVWLAACYGADVQGTLNNTWKTWIAQVGGSPSAVNELAGAPATINVYPSPAVDFFNLTFHVTDRAVHAIRLMDSKGALVKLLYEGTPALGQNKLMFNRGQLSRGQYVVTITSNNNTVAHEKLVIE